jgi:PAS domain S-box-containing protein
MATDAWVLQALVDANDQAVFALDRDLRYLAFNEAHAQGMRALYGAEIELGGRLTDYQTVVADRDGAQRHIDRALAGERIVASAFSGHEEHERRLYDLFHTPLTGEDGTVVGVVVCTDDVTDRRAAENGLRASEERYTALFENMLEGYAYCRMLYDADGQPNDWVYLAVNPAFERLTGLLGVTGKPVTEIVPAVSFETPELFDLYGAVARSGEPVEFDIDFTPLGLWLHISAFQPEPDHFVAVFTDVTESRRAEQALRLSEERLTRALTAAKAGTWEWDLGTGANAWSDELWELYDLDRDGLDPTYDLWLESIHPQHREQTAATVAAAAAAGMELNAEWRVNTRDGSRRWLVSRGSPVRNAGGEVVRYSGVVMDITARRRVEDEIRLLNADLERRVTERTRDLTAANAELEEFVHSIAHDLRSPLRALSGFSELVELDFGDVIDETGRDYLHRIRDAAGHLGRLMDALLSLSQIGRRELKVRDVDMSKLAREVAEELQATYPERDVDVEIEQGLVARGDPALCEIIVQNLLGNAWKFSAGEEHALIRFRAERVDGRRVFCVADNGVGFDPEFAGKLFTPFERLHTRDEFPGTGIGLATVRRAVTRLGGCCWADAEQGSGARVYFNLGETD